MLVTVNYRIRKIRFERKAALRRRQRGKDKGPSAPIARFLPPLAAIPPVAQVVCKGNPWSERPGCCPRLGARHRRAHVGEYFVLRGSEFSAALGELERGKGGQQGGQQAEANTPNISTSGYQEGKEKLKEEPAETT